MQNRPREFRAGGLLTVHMRHNAEFVKGGRHFPHDNSPPLHDLNEARSGNAGRSMSTIWRKPPFRDNRKPITRSPVENHAGNFVRDCALSWASA